MICPSCQEGARLYAEAEVCEASEDNITRTAATTIRYAAKDQHDKCKGGTWCDCQHVLGRVNSEVVSSRADAGIPAA